MSTAYLSLGSNLGDRKANLEAALMRLQCEAVCLDAVSSIYETEHVGEFTTDFPVYLNLAARVTTEFTAIELLKHFHRIG